MILGVFGPRDLKAVGAEARVAAQRGHYYNNYPYIADSLDEYEAKKIITGGGNGIEQLALRYAVEKDIEHEVIPPRLNLYGHDAWKVRNREILTVIDIAVLFWDGKDKFYYELMQEAVEQKRLLHLRHME